MPVINPEPGKATSPGLERDLAEIAAESQTETTVGTPAQDLSHAAQVEQLKADMIEPPEIPYSPASDLVSRALKAYSATSGEPSTASGLRLVPEFVEFRKQVIAAFKHMGLDTNKFFGV